MSGYRESSEPAREEVDVNDARGAATRKPRTVCGCQPVERMTVAIVAPLGPQSRASTRACFEFARVC